jgi:hypothetical protein
VNKRGGFTVDEKEYRATLTKEELSQRSFIIPFKVVDLEIWEKLNQHSAELAKTYDQLINTALVRFFEDIELVNRLRLP